MPLTNCEDWLMRSERHEPAVKPQRIRLSIVVSHPIQYQAPLFRRLAQSSVVDPVVLFLSDYGLAPSFDPGFGRDVAYNVSLVEGYRHIFLRKRYRRPFRRAGERLSNPGLARLLSPQATDLALVHGWAHASERLALGFCFLRGVPYLIRGEARVDTEVLLSPSRRFLKRRLLRPLIRRAAGCLAIGKLNKEFYLGYGARRDRIFFAPYSVETDRFEAAGDRGRRLRRQRLHELGLDPRLPVVLFVGKLQPWKRPLDVVSAVEQVGLPLNLVFIGDGALRQAVETAATRLPNARVLGFVNQQEIGTWYGLADIFVLPSDVEPWGLAVNEAMAAGAVPVVSDASGCAPDLVTEDTGRIFPAGDTRTLASVLEELLGEPSQLPALARVARQRSRKYGIESTAQGIEEATIMAMKLKR